MFSVTAKGINNLKSIRQRRFRRPRPEAPLPAAPARHPDYDAAATRALLQGANEGDSASAEEATGYRFGEPALVPYVRVILERARKEKNDRLEQLAERFLTRAGVELDDD